jgi:tRNA (guanine-N7-)-methyltransferase
MSLCVAASEDPRADAGEPPARRKLFGRRKGKALRPSQHRLLEEILPRVRVELPASGLDLAALFGGAVREVWLEIGFGGGEHLAAQAARHPDVGLIGCEPFVNGVAMALGRIESGALGNVRIHPGDARDLIDHLPDGSIGRVFLLYPDPWPKARHHRRRFMNPENLRSLARVLRPGAELRLATDIAEYMDHALAAVAASEGLFECAAPVALGRDAAGADWPGTRYEAKALRAGRVPRYATIRRT